MPIKSDPKRTQPPECQLAEKLFVVIQLHPSIAKDIIPAMLLASNQCAKQNGQVSFSQLRPSNNSSSFFCPYVKRARNLIAPFSGVHPHYARAQEALENKQSRELSIFHSLMAVW